MMKTTLKVFVLLAALSLIGGASGVARGSRDPEDATLRDIARYREWTRVTEKPLLVANSSVGG
jgi:hypothetical protein